MRADIVAGALFPDYELADHHGVHRKLSELQRGDPLVLVLSRGGFCPKERRQHEGLLQLHREMQVGYCQLVTISTDNLLETNEFRAGVGAGWTFLSDPARRLQKDLDIVEYTDPQVRARWESRLADVGVGALHAELAHVDAAAAASILPTDGRRIVRALEVVELTGRPFAASAPTIGAPRWNTIIVGLDWDTTLLDERLALRTQKMFDDGLVDEVVALQGQGLRRGVTASRALGYAQVLDALEAGGGTQPLAEAQERTFIGTRRYVRRQRSWFRRDHRIHWLDGSAPGNADTALLLLRQVS